MIHNGKVLQDSFAFDIISDINDDHSGDFLHMDILLKASKLSDMLPYFSNKVIIHINVGLQQSSTHTFLIISSQVKVCRECVLSFRHFLLRLLAQNKITFGILFRPGS